MLVMLVEDLSAELAELIGDCKVVLRSLVKVLPNLELVERVSDEGLGVIKGEALVEMPLEESTNDPMKLLRDWETVPSALLAVLPSTELLDNMPNVELGAVEEETPVKMLLEDSTIDPMKLFGDCEVVPIALFKAFPTVLVDRMPDVELEASEASLVGVEVNVLEFPGCKMLPVIEEEIAEAKGLEVLKEIGGVICRAAVLVER